MTGVDASNSISTRATKYPNVIWSSDEAMNTKLEDSLDTIFDKKNCLPDTAETQRGIGDSKVLDALKNDIISFSSYPWTEAGPGHIYIGTDTSSTLPSGYFGVKLIHEATHSIDTVNDDVEQEALAYYNGDTYERKLTATNPELFVDSDGATWKDGKYDDYIASYNNNPSNPAQVYADVKTAVANDAECTDQEPSLN